MRFMIVRLLAVLQIPLYVQKIIRFSMVPDEGPFTDTIRFSLLKGNRPTETVFFHLNCIEPHNHTVEWKVELMKVKVPHLLSRV